MNLDELRSVQSKERQKDSLQNLRPSFYREVGEYIADLETERDRVAEAADDPFSSPEVSQLTDEIETAKDVVEAIYERRMGKLVKQASLAAAGMPANDEGLTAEEADLFDDLVDRIGSNKSRVLDVLEGVEDPAAGTADATSAPDPGTQKGGEPATPDARSTGPIPDSATDDAPPAPPAEPSTDVDPATAADDGDDSGGVTPADVMGSDGPSIGDASGEPADPDAVSGPSERSDGVEPDSADGSTSEQRHGDAMGRDDATGDSSAGTADDLERMTVRITSDIGAILGVDDREYTLTSDDIVDLPEQNAAPLIEREAAERLE